MSKFKIEMGLEVKDIITNFQGIVGGRAEYLTGCNTYLVQPKSEKNKYPESTWIDEGRLRVIGKKKLLMPEDVKSDDGDGCDSCQPSTK